MGRLRVLSTPSFWESTLKLLLVLVSLSFVLVFLIVSFRRLLYPYELEWMEGGSVDHVLRLIQGLPLYVSPTLDFTPYRYTPLYYFVGWFVAQITGIGFVPLRIVSILSTLACFGLVFQFVRKETGNVWAGLVGVGFLAATYPIGGDWFDVGRCDMLFIALLLGGLYALRFYASGRGVLMASLLFSLSYLTKQVATLVIVPMALYLLVVDRKRGVLFICGTVVGIVATSLAFEQVYQGWYSYYTFELGRSITYRGTLIGRFRSYLHVLVLRPFPVVSLLGLFYLVYRTFQAKNLRNRLYYWFALGSLTFSAFLLWINAGSYYNNLIPQHVALSLVLGCGLGVVIEKARSGSSVRMSAVSIAVLLLTIGQMAAMRYDPAGLIPTSADRQAGDAFVNLMRSIDGEVLVPFHGYIPVLAGKRSHAQRMAMQDGINRTRGHPRDSLLADIRRCISEKKFSAIILDHRWFDREMSSTYDSTGVVFADTTVYWPVTGWRIRPTTIFRPKPPTEIGDHISEIDSTTKVKR